MTAVSVAYAVRRHFMKGDIYTLKLNRRGQMIPEELVADLGSHVVIDDVASDNIAFLTEDDMIAGDKDFACITEGDRVVGIVDLHSRHLDHEVPVKSLKQKPFVILRPGTTLTAAIAQFYQENRDVALISRSGDADKESVLGVVSARHLINMIGDVSKTLR